MNATQVRALGGAVALAVVGLFLFVLLTVVITRDPGPTGLDQRVLELADELNSGFGEALAKVVTVFGSLPVTGTFVVAGAVLLAIRHRPVELAVLLGASVAIYAAVHVTKAAIDRPRPPRPLTPTSLSAFPSGHSAYSTVYVALAVIALRVSGRAAGRRALVVAGIVAALAIGASRAYLRVHWGTDVLAGWALGAAIFGLLAAIAVVVGHFRNNGRGEPPAVPAGGNAPRT